MYVVRTLFINHLSLEMEVHTVAEGNIYIYILLSTHTILMYLYIITFFQEKAFASTGLTTEKVIPLAGMHARTGEAGSPG